MKGGQIFGPLARGHHVETGGARPIDEFANQRGLVAIAHRVDDAGALRFAREKGPCEAIRFNIDHDDRLTVGKGRAGMGDAGGRRAGDFEHHVDIVAGAQFLAVFDEVNALYQLVFPAHGAAGGARAAQVEIGDGGYFQRAGRRLIEKHGAELSGADEADPDRVFTPLDAREGEGMEIHGCVSLVDRAPLSAGWGQPPPAIPPAIAAAQEPNRQPAGSSRQMATSAVTQAEALMVYVMSWPQHIGDLILP